MKTKEITSLVARFRIGETAYKYFLEERLVVTDDNVNDYETFDDIQQRYESFFSKNIMVWKGYQLQSKQALVVEESKSDELHLTAWLLENPMLLPMYFARDNEHFGPDHLNRCDVYILTNVEVLTMKELKQRQLEQMKKAPTFMLKKCIHNTASYCYKYWEAMGYVIFTTVLCLGVPLPLCVLVLYHQKLYEETTAVTNEFTPELLLTKPLNVLYWRTHSMSSENQLVLLLSLPYYLISTIKLYCFFLNIKGPCRKIVRVMFVSFSFFWSLLSVAWLIVILLWILLGAVLNPIAVLAHSVAVGGKTIAAAAVVVAVAAAATNNITTTDTALTILLLPILLLLLPPLLLL